MKMSHGLREVRHDTTRAVAIRSFILAEINTRALFMCRNDEIKYIWNEKRTILSLIIIKNKKFYIPAVKNVYFWFYRKAENALKQMFDICALRHTLTATSFLFVAS